MPALDSPDNCERSPPILANVDVADDEDQLYDNGLVWVLKCSYCRQSGERRFENTSLVATSTFF